MINHRKILAKKKTVHLTRSWTTSDAFYGEAFWFEMNFWEARLSIAVPRCLLNKMKFVKKTSRRVDSTPFRKEKGYTKQTDHAFSSAFASGLISYHWGQDFIAFLPSISVSSWNSNLRSAFRTRRRMPIIGGLSVCRLSSARNIYTSGWEGEGTGLWVIPGEGKWDGSEVCVQTRGDDGNTEGGVCMADGCIARQNTYLEITS